MEFRNPTQADIDYVRSHPYEGAVKNYPYMEVPDDNSYAVIDEGELVAVGGLYIKWEGVGLLWLILTENCKKTGFHGVRALLAISQKSEELIKKNKLWRVEATIRPDFIKAIKMVEFLGFTRDCKLVKYFPDKTDAYLYSRIIT